MPQQHDRPFFLGEIVFIVGWASSNALAAITRNKSSDQIATGSELAASSTAILQRNRRNDALPVDRAVLSPRGN